MKENQESLMANILKNLNQKFTQQIKVRMNTMRTCKVLKTKRLRNCTREIAIKKMKSRISKLFRTIIHISYPQVHHKRIKSKIITTKIVV